MQNPIQGTDKLIASVAITYAADRPLVVSITDGAGNLSMISESLIVEICDSIELTFQTGTLHAVTSMLSMIKDPAFNVGGRINLRAIQLAIAASVQARPLPSKLPDFTRKVLSRQTLPWRHIVDEYMKDTKEGA